MDASRLMDLLWESPVEPLSSRFTSDTVMPRDEIIKMINKENNMKNVLFLAPGYRYACTVVENLGKELDRNKICYAACEDPGHVSIGTDRIIVSVIYTDPIQWTTKIFEKRDAVFGKKELIDKAVEQFFYLNIPRPRTSLVKYILDQHETHNDEPIRTSYIPGIKNVYFNNPMTVVLWEDGTKTIVKCQEGDEYSEELGLAMCISKKSFGNCGNYNNVFKKWIPEKEVTIDEVHKDLTEAEQSFNAAVANLKSSIKNALIKVLED